MIRDAVDADLPRILAIVNQAIVETTASWTITPLTLGSRVQWLAERRAQGLPVLVAATGDGIAGFGSFGAFRPYDAYADTVEHSVYVDLAAHRRGHGRALLEALIERARRLGKHVMVGAVGADNTASIALHRRLGFVETGRMPEVGRKFGRRLDLVLMQLRL